MAPLRHVTQLLGKHSVIMAVNDNPDVTHANGGSHWSLAVLHGTTLLHIDSHGDANAHVAKRLFHALQTALAQHQASVEQLIQASCAQQNNGYDCGMHVLGVLNCCL